MTYFIDFEPVGRRGSCRDGETLLECARALGVGLVNICGGSGCCGSCLVQVVEGNVSPVADAEREHISQVALSQGYRLACHATPQSDCKVQVPVESLSAPQRIQLEGQEIQFEPDPVAQSYHLVLSPPSFNDLRSDAERVAQKIAEESGPGNLKYDIKVLGGLSNTLRENHWRARAVVYQEELIAVLPQESKPLGVAVDLGSTKIAIYLIDLETGCTLALKGVMNPQIAYGEDIMTRMTAAQSRPEIAGKFQSMVVEAVNGAMAELCRVCGIGLEHIVNMVVVGNTAMHHLFLGLPVRQLGRAPYVPGAAGALDIKARDVGLTMAPGAYVHLLPNVAGYVGADHVAMLLASQIENRPGVVLAIDIGTNTEICLSNRGALASLSTASGPAFEGAHIRYGMRAAPGAIERFQIIDGKNTYQTIENAPAAGICGSGILDILAGLRKEGIVNRRGKILDHPHVRGEGKERAYMVASDRENGNEVTFSQADIEQIQLAKGAIRTGIEVLLARHGLSPDDIDKIIIAGAFGTYLDVGNAIEIGMFPNIPPSRFEQIGNAAGVGAKLALLSGAKRKAAVKLAKTINYIELAGDPSFPKIFAKSMRLG